MKKKSQIFLFLGFPLVYMTFVNEGNEIERREIARIARIKAFRRENNISKAEMTIYDVKTVKINNKKYIDDKMRFM